MKSLRTLLCLLAGLAAFALPARTVYITRHGQVDGKNRISKQVRDVPLTQLGEKQALALAEYLIQKCRFNGRIYVSPFYRTIQTGTFTANLLKSKVILEPGIQEIAPGPKPGYSMDMQTIEKYFPGQTVPGKRFSDTWRLFDENAAKRTVRIQKALKEILAEEKGDILLVGHGGVIGPLINYLNAKKASPAVKHITGKGWNCSLYIFELDEKDQVKGGRYTTEFMEDKDITNNFRAPKILRPDDPRYAKTDKKKKSKGKQKK